jgi:hypothetical protein
MGNEDFRIAESLEETRIVGKLRTRNYLLSLISSPFRNSATPNPEYFSKTDLVLEWRRASDNSAIRIPHFAIFVQSAFRNF